MIKQKNKNILLVEDEAITALNEKQELENIGYNVTHVFNADEAIKLVLNQNSNFDIILMDIDLGGGLDGTQAAELILKNRDIPIIFLSSHIEEEIVKKTEKITSYGYVIKNSGIFILDASIKMAFKLFEAKTKEKQRAKELFESESKFRQIYENVNIGIIQLLLDFRILSANPAFCKMLGYTEEELIGKNIGDITHPGLVEENLQKQMLLAKGEIDSYEVEKMFIHKDGHTVYGILNASLIRDDDGIPKYLLGSVLDITMQVVTMNKLRESEQSFRDMFENHAAIKLLVDPDTGNILDANPSAARFYGWSREQLRKMKIQDINQLTPEEIKQELEKARTLKKIYFEFRHKLADNSIRDVAVFSSNFTSKGKNILLSIIHDITDQKKAEKELMQQLADKELLLKEIHHRVKNNIANVEALLNLQASSTNIQEVKDALEEAIVRVSSMRILYEKLLLSKDYEEISIKSYIENLIDSIFNVFVCKCHIIVEKKIVDFNIIAKKAIYVGIIVNELLTNVVKYAFKDRENGVVKIIIDKEENKITLIIKDNGVGIDYKRVSGFGLTIVKMLVEQLKGTFEIINDNGTTSIVKFLI
ncbi:MAG: PAS domain S-box protein [Brevinematales bacterium]|nr:PAS domain S-box protein [Brevinematales bacterium]